MGLVNKTTALTAKIAPKTKTWIAKALEAKALEATALTAIAVKSALTKSLTKTPETTLA